MAFKKYGKHINTDKMQQAKPLRARPSNQHSSLSMSLQMRLQQISNTLKNPKRYTDGHVLFPTFPTDGTSSSPSRRQSRNYTPDLANPMYNYLMKNSITRISTTLKSNTTGTTSISILAPGVDYLLRKGDTFYLYNRKTFNSMQLTADADLLSTDTTITITATNFKRTDYYMGGSFVVADNKIMMERASNAPEFKRYDLTNTEYKNLNSAPYTLLAAETGKLHIPLNATIIYNHGSDELTRADLYIGHNSPSTNIREYWASINEAFYRSRDPQLLQLSPGIYGAGASTDFASIAVKSKRSNAVGEALRLYGSADFTSPSSTITVVLYYKTIVI